MMLSDYGIIRLDTALRVDRMHGKLGFSFVQ